MDFLRLAIEELLANRTPSLRVAVDRFVRLVRTHQRDAEAIAMLQPRIDVGSRWALAALLENTSEPEAADALYARVVDGEGREIPDVLLRRARLCAQGGEEVRAVRFLRLALQEATDYSF